ASGVAFFSGGSFSGEEYASSSNLTSGRGRRFGTTASLQQSQLPPATEQHRPWCRPRQDPSSCSFASIALFAVACRAGSRPIKPTERETTTTAKRNGQRAFFQEVPIASSFTERKRVRVGSPYTPSRMGCN